MWGYLTSCHPSKICLSQSSPINHTLNFQILPVTTIYCSKKKKGSNSPEPYTHLEQYFLGLLRPHPGIRLFNSRLQIQVYPYLATQFWDFIMTKWLTTLLLPPPKITRPCSPPVKAWIDSPPTQDRYEPAPFSPSAAGHLPLSQTSCLPPTHLLLFFFFKKGLFYFLNLAPTLQQPGEFCAEIPLLIPPPVHDTGRAPLPFQQISKKLRVLAPVLSDCSSQDLVLKQLQGKLCPCHWDFSSAQLTPWRRKWAWTGFHNRGTCKGLVPS